jgi:glyoxylase-like metal-dependent hydrolase (beta-lactamase superfamily II)
MFTQPMGQTYNLNIGLILGNQYNYVIDTGLGSGSIRPIIEYLGDDKKPVIVVNTHCHWDHIWGNWMFENSIIISHVKCRELMDKHWDEAISELSKHKDGDVHKSLPNLVIENNIYFPNDSIEIFYSPGHDVDCISIYDAIDRVLYVGDNIGDTEDEIVPYIGTDKETYKGTVDLYKKYDFEICISGHNKPQGKDVISRIDAAFEDSWKRQGNL